MMFMILSTTFESSTLNRDCAAIPLEAHCRTSLLQADGNGASISDCAKYMLVYNIYCLNYLHMYTIYVQIVYTMI